MLQKKPDSELSTVFSFSSQCTTQGKLTATAKMDIEVRWVIALLSCDARLRSENQCMTKTCQKGRAIGIWEAGLSMRQISQRVGVAVQTISDWKSRYVVEGNVTRRRRSGRPRQTTERSDRFLVRLAKKHRLLSAPALLQQWKERVSRWTVRRRLLDKQLRSYRPALCTIWKDICSGAWQNRLGGFQFGNGWSSPMSRNSACF